MALFLHSERFQRLFKEGFWVVLGQVMLILGSLVGVRILTGLMSPSAYGEVALGMTIVALVNYTVLGPLGNGFARFYAPAVEKGDLRGYLQAVKRLVLLATGLIVLVCLLVTIGLFIFGRKEWIGIVIAAFIVAIVTGLNSNLNGIQNAARQRFIVAIYQGIQPWVRVLVSASLIILIGSNSTVAMVGYAIGVMLVLGVQYLSFHKVIPTTKIATDSGRNWTEEIWAFSWPSITWGIFVWAQMSSDRWALGIFSTMHDVGKYAVLYQLGYYPISIVTGMVMQFLAPIFYQRAGDASDSQRIANVNRLSWYLAGLTIGVTGVAFLTVLSLHTQIFRIFVAKEYASVSYLLPWILLSGGIFTAGQTFELKLMSHKKTNAMIVVKIITAMLGVIFNFIGAYLYGIVGIVFASILYSAVYFLWILVLSRKVLA